jgi:hypothetical protein
MRAHVSLAAALLVTACGPNPAFKIAGEGNDGGGSGDGLSTGDAASEGSTAAPPVEPPCTPTPLVPYTDDICAATRFPFDTPNLMAESIFSGVDCGMTNTVYVERVSPTELQQSGTNCMGAPDPTRSFSIAGFKDLSDIDKLFPPIGACARLWHVSKMGADNLCKSVAYAFWDTAGSQQLRLAITGDDLNPFAGLPELPIVLSSEPGDEMLCETPGLTCAIQNVSVLTVNLDGCEFPAPQNAEWTDIPFAGRDYKFSSRSYTCATEGAPFVGWYLRLAAP